MMRRTPHSLKRFVAPFTPKDQVERQMEAHTKLPVGEKIKMLAGTSTGWSPAGFQILLTSRPWLYLVAGSGVGALLFIFGSGIQEEEDEKYGFDYELKEPDTLFALGKDYWVQQWRMGYSGWKKEESTPFFYASKFLFAKEVTGWDLYNPQTWFEEEQQKKAKMLPKNKEKRNNYKSKTSDGREEQQQILSSYPRAFVPMCGDSDIVPELGKMGYEVDAVDSTDIPVRTLANKVDHLPLETINRIHLHYNDIFAASFWKGMSSKHFDVIWDRQGMTALSGEQRDDYAFLMKRALKDKGVIVLEGCYRTPKIRGNKGKGPPFEMGVQHYERYFPKEDGFTVKCQNVEDDYLRDFGPEGRVTGKVWKAFAATTYGCVAYRGFDLAEGDQPRRE